MMKSLTLFIRTTFTGGIIFLLPVVLLIMFFAKAYELLSEISRPVAERLPEIILGLDGSILVTIFLLILFCFLGGLVFRSLRVKRWVDKLEENVLTYLPGYSLVKAITADAIGARVGQNMNPILIQDGETWNIGFLVEEGKTHSTVFIPDAPRHDAGEIKIVPTAFVRRLDISSNKFAQSINLYGKGAIHWIKSAHD